MDFITNGRQMNKQDHVAQCMSNLPEFKINEESKMVLKEILRSKDRDNKGYVDIDELGDCLEAFGFDPDDEDLEFLKRHMDDNGDGHLEVEEVLENIEVINYHCWYGKVLMDEFRYIDQDKDGYIRFPEMLKVLTNRGEMPVLEARRLLDALARNFDANFDGKFSYPEFVKIYMSDLLPFRDEIESGSFKTSVKTPADSKSAQPKKKKVLKKRLSENGTLGSANPQTNHSKSAASSNPDSHKLTDRKTPMFPVHRPKTGSRPKTSSKPKTASSKTRTKPAADG